MAILLVVPNNNPNTTQKQIITPENTTFLSRYHMERGEGRLLYSDLYLKNWVKSPIIARIRIKGERAYGPLGFN